MATARSEVAVVGVLEISAHGDEMVRLLFNAAQSVPHTTSCIAADTGSLFMVYAKKINAQTSAPIRLALVNLDSPRCAKHA